MSALIKAGAPRPAATGFARLNLRDIAREAQALLSDARAQGAQLVEQASAEADRRRTALLEQTRRDGYAVGLAQGREAGRTAALDEARKRFGEDQSQLIAVMSETIAQFAESRERFIAAQRRDVLLLSVAIARKIVSTMAESEAASVDIATEAADEALNLVRSATDVEVRVNPADANGMETFVDDLMTRLRDGRHVRVVEDDKIARGGVRVATADSIVDGSIASRVDRIARALVENWRERSRELSLDS